MICSSSELKIRFIVILWRTLADVTALKPSACMVMSGVMATIATTPNASVKILSAPPFNATHAPTISGKMKLDVNGPEATPPESNAIAV